MYNLARNPSAIPHHTDSADGLFVGSDNLFTFDGKGIRFSRPAGTDPSAHRVLARC